VQEDWQRHFLPLLRPAHSGAGGDLATSAIPSYSTTESKKVNKKTRLKTRVFEPRYEMILAVNNTQKNLIFHVLEKFSGGLKDSSGARKFFFTGLISTYIRIFSR
jgi:hypothetical protein